MSHIERQWCIWCIIIAAAIIVLVVTCFPVRSHDSWISRGGHRNAAGEWCCGTGDCFVVPKDRISTSAEGYLITRGPLAGEGPIQIETVPYGEAQPSPDGEFWRCRRPDGSRRCFFAPPPST